jgi:crossover junction endodeoxyribonuclease RuvC
MKPAAWIGADPGASGAIAAYVPTYECQVVVTDMPRLDDGMDYWTLAAHLRNWAENFDVRGVTIERVHAMPNQGVTSMFSFGQSFGALKQAVASAGLTFTLVTPGTWKAIYGLRGGRDNKAASAEKAIELFPGIRSVLYGPKGGVKDGRADAILLAHYGSKLR